MKKRKIECKKSKRVSLIVTECAFSIIFKSPLVRRCNGVKRSEDSLRMHSKMLHRHPPLRRTERPGLRSLIFLIAQRARRITHMPDPANSSRISPIGRTRIGRLDALRRRRRPSTRNRRLFSSGNPDASRRCANRRVRETWCLLHGCSRYRRSRSDVGTRAFSECRFACRWCYARHFARPFCIGERSSRTSYTIREGRRRSERDRCFERR